MKQQNNLIGQVLADIPESKAALENVNVFKKAWVDQVLTSEMRFVTTVATGGRVGFRPAV